MAKTTQVPFQLFIHSGWSKPLWMLVMFGLLWASTPKNTQGLSNLIFFYIGFCFWGAELNIPGMDYYTLYILNGYTLCKFTLSYTD